MPTRFETLNPNDLDMGRLYGLLVGLVQPRPIGFISTVSRSGHRNLAPFSFFMVGGVNPGSVVFCPTNAQPERPKDSLLNAEETGEFVVNLVTREMCEGMNRTAYDFPSEVDEWEVSGFSPVPSQVVRPERVLESPAQFECRTFRVVRHGVGKGAGNYVIGEVVRLHIHHDLMMDGALVEEAFSPVARLGGKDYLDMGTLQKFQLERPKAPSASSIEV